MFRKPKFSVGWDDYSKGVVPTTTEQIYRKSNSLFYKTLLGTILMSALCTYYSIQSVSFEEELPQQSSLEVTVKESNILPMPSDSFYTIVDDL